MEIDARASVWFNATLRGDMSYIRIGPGTSIADNVVIHTEQDGPTVIGAQVVVDAGATVHSSVVADLVHVGARAVLTGRNNVGTETVIAVGALLPEGSSIDSRTVVAGVPARVIRKATSQDSENTRRSAENLFALSREYLRSAV